MKQLEILFRAIIGNLFKLKALFCLMLNIKPKNSQKKAENVVVSLTSYGKRVKNCVAYSIYSIYKQSVNPEKIILWLDGINWNNQNLPFLLKRLIEWGNLEVKFCEDIRSYKKLIPALKEYSNKCIITIDDDIYYSTKLVEKLYYRHKEFPNKICATHYFIPTFTSKGEICPYRLWITDSMKQDICNRDEKILMPSGFGGVLYPPNCFDKDVFDKNVFLKLCPLADDLWFYLMAIKKQTLRTNVPNSSIKFYDIDLFRQLATKDRLHDINVKENQNDIQLEKVIEYYGIQIMNI